MARFPETEPEIAALAVLLVQGLREAAADFPAPPVSADELEAKLDAYNAAGGRAVAAETAAREQHAAKDEALKDLAKSIRVDLEYAEFAAGDRSEKLNQLGWGPRRDRTPLPPPGEVRDMKIAAEGDTWVILNWRPPVDGGAVGVYQIQRMREPGAWEDATISTSTEQLMSNQPRGVELSFRVFAVNKAGTGQPGATVTMVL